MHQSKYNPWNDLCDVNDQKIAPAPPIPSCLKSSIRIQHFGCDFHVDEDLSGYETRLFECNKGPSMLSDVVEKRKMAADIFNFVGFKGSFNGSDDAAKLYNMRLIYDSDTFQEKDLISFLQSLKDKKYEVWKNAKIEQFKDEL